MTSSAKEGLSAIEVFAVILVGVLIGGTILATAGYTIPPIVTDEVKAVWGVLTAGSVAGMILRSLKRPLANAGQLFGWTGAAGLAFVLSVLLVGFFVPSDPARRFNIIFAQFQGLSTPTDVKFAQKYPAYSRLTNQLPVDAPNSLQGTPVAFDAPSAQEDFDAQITAVPWDVRDSRTYGTTKQKAAEQPVGQICLAPASVRKSDNTTLIVSCDAREQSCSFEKPVPGWVKARTCASSTTGGRTAIQGYFALNAAEQRPAETNDDGQLWWRVPNPSTLEELRKQGKSPAYTTFNVKSDTVPAGADSYTYQLRSNGTNLMVDGLDKSLLWQRIGPSRAFDLSFALENLDFLGRTDGCEELGVQIDFLKAGKTIRHVDLTRPYAALRKPETVTVFDRSGSGLAFKWGGDYKPSQILENTESILFSLPDNQKTKDRLRTAQSLIDELLLTAPVSLGSRTLTSYIRPPLRRSDPEFGLALALRVERGQSQFIFDFQTANALFDWARPAMAKALQPKLQDVDRKKRDMARDLLGVLQSGAAYPHSANNQIGEVPGGACGTFQLP